MAWTAPKTFSDGSVLTAAELNTHLRDNFLETSAATVTTAGDIVYADGANSMGSRLGIGSDRSHLVSDGTSPIWRKTVATERTDSQTATTTSYLTLADVAGGGWGFAAEVEVTVATGTHALVLMQARFSNDTAGSSVIMSYSVSSATTIAASNLRSIQYESSVGADIASFGGWDNVNTLTAGSNVFTLEGRVTGNTGTISEPRIMVVPLN